MALPWVCERLNYQGKNAEGFHAERRKLSRRRGGRGENLGLNFGYASRKERRDYANQIRRA